MSKSYAQKLYEMIHQGRPEFDGAGKARSHKQLMEAAEMLSDVIWYNRHQNRLIDIEEGEIKIVEKGEVAEPGGGRSIHRDVLDKAQKAALKLEKKYGEENLGPWDDFEWGMINGKLSALRWALGEVWDDLET